ncbi:NAD(P)-dependent hydrogenase/sulfhydrogenase 2 subunit delta [Pyrococcus yayanosii]|uniref:NiFe hydrogenase II, subunit delta n=1 Tax=Pyrococcus yayanosii (strain CH1 / JCM 16557) TaxID=529709 RepID=F8AF43_PYRYC|nr:NAD(P)-dependent hydrogenase/sulfhydrogenase 2 subunit delta [Pyrococcus yayanosii]AEH23717.1 NiFe hydrogenase II, subunit delta [Pyrococcus yayanosii CH1]
MMEKLRLGVFELTDCGGCALNLLFLYEKFFDVLEFYEITEFHMATSIKEKGPLDIALVTGTVSTQRDLDLLREARNRAKYLIALGTCATHGSLQASVEGRIRDRLERVYGTRANPMKALESKPVTDYVPVDYALPGCPYDKEELFQVLMEIAKGVEPVRKDYPVCLECKLNEYECVFLKRNIPCLGPVTYGGCNAPCVRSGLGCIGCRGPLPGANLPGHVEVLRSLGLDDEEIARKLRTFARWEP